MASVHYCGRELSEADLEVIRGLAATLPTRTAVAAAACEALGWQGRDGRSKEMSARVALLRMAADGLLTLPAPRNGNGNGRLSRRIERFDEPPPALAASLAGLGHIAARDAGAGARSGPSISACRPETRVPGIKELGLTALLPLQLTRLTPLTAPAADCRRA